MEFDDEDISYQFYNKYAEKSGFSICKSSVKFNSENVVTSQKILCSKHGFRENIKGEKMVKKTRLETRTGCNAFMSIKIMHTKRYHVSGFEDNHN
ncbi:hypothetical protein QJS04_geneDACA012849 [Acorus gramineus]|uniref:FAR1 domain-containing protein n=1 Tax=Acorus gramineus TaxID=55184 RepID=A0AAV9BFQ0_ACOGR|nr:hypothetical protein QJS04_geneDACA012849 [Acorus gramineus]